MADEDINTFLWELSELSRKYGIDISEVGMLYELEQPDDCALDYVLGDNGELARRY